MITYKRIFSVGHDNKLNKMLKHICKTLHQNNAAQCLMPHTCCRSRSGINFIL